MSKMFKVSGTFLNTFNKSETTGTMREILIFLESCPTEFKADVASNVVLVSAKYAPNAQWHIDTILKVTYFLSYLDF